MGIELLIILIILVAAFSYIVASSLVEIYRKLEKRKKLSIIFGIVAFLLIYFGGFLFAIFSCSLYSSMKEYVIVRDAFCINNKGFAEYIVILENKLKSPITKGELTIIVNNNLYENFSLNPDPAPPNQFFNITIYTNKPYLNESLRHFIEIRIGTRAPLILEVFCP